MRSALLLQHRAPLLMSLLMCPSLVACDDDDATADGTSDASADTHSGGGDTTIGGTDTSAAQDTADAGPADAIDLAAACVDWDGEALPDLGAAATLDGATAWLNTDRPLSLADEKTSIILAGDHCQLGPVVHAGLFGCCVAGCKIHEVLRLSQKRTRNTEPVHPCATQHCFDWRCVN